MKIQEFLKLADQIRRMNDTLTKVRDMLGAPRDSTLTQAAARLLQERDHLLVENEQLRIACGSGWGEPTLINMLRAEKEQLLAENERLRVALTDLLNVAAWSEQVSTYEQWAVAVSAARRALATPTVAPEPAEDATSTAPGGAGRTE